MSIVHHFFPLNLVCIFIPCKDFSFLFPLSFLFYFSLLFFSLSIIGGSLIPLHVTVTGRSGRISISHSCLPTREREAKPLWDSIYMTLDYLPPSFFVLFPIATGYIPALAEKLEMYLLAGICKLHNYTGQTMCPCR
jgi:hypothetical protein